MELLILAGGMGSRFGGLKQIEPMGPNKEFIIDYSIYDAIKAGFDKVIFVIKKENYEVFKETIGARVEPHIKVEYVFQEMDDLPEKIEIPEARVKPWGTAHAIYSARKVIDDKFVIVNADDFYGFDAFRVAAEFLKTSKKGDFAVVGYQVNNTLSENGAVKRGVIRESNGMLDEIIESNIERKDNKIIAMPLNGGKEIELSEDSLVSMNMMAFDKNILLYIEEIMKDFLIVNQYHLDTCEYLIPDVLNNVNKQLADVYVLKTNANWYGVTYREDTDYVKSKIKEEINSGKYPNNLWEE